MDSKWVVARPEPGANSDIRYCAWESNVLEWAYFYLQIDTVSY